MIYAFGDCELDAALYQLRRRKKVVKIEPKVFDVLHYLVRQRERVVSKNELLDSLWAGEAVSESVLPRCIAAARRAVGDDRSRQKVLQTLHGRGYRFVAPLREVESRPEAAPGVEAAEAPAAQPGASQGATSSPFVGRDDAMARLRDGLDAAARAEGRIALVVGEPGIGKTRTCDELETLARERTFTVLTGRCYEGEGAPAFWPWVQVLRACIRENDPAQLQADLGPGAPEIATLVPELRELLPELPEVGGAEGEQARFRLFDSITQYLRRVATRRPLLVVIDDLHWADPSSTLLVRFLADELRAMRMLLVGTYRDVEVRRGSPLRTLLGALARAPRCERVALRGLAEPDVARLVASLAGNDASVPALALLCEMTEGNPFFITEIARLLVRRDAADETSAAELELPQSVRDVIGRRLDGLSNRCNETLRAASVLGRDFQAGVLQRVLSVSAGALLEPLGEAQEAGLVRSLRDGVGRFAFQHALIRQTLYEELRAPVRVRLHRQAGEALEAACGADPEPHLAELAHHFYEAAPGGDVDKAVDYERRAAARAHALLAYEESASHYARALEALELRVPRDDVTRCELLLALGEEHWTAGAREAARSQLFRAADLARHLGRTDLLARAAVDLRGFGEMGVPPDEATLGLLEEARGAIGDAYPLWRSRLLSRLAGAFPYARSMETRVALASEAFAIAQELDDPTALRDSLGARWWAALGPDRVPERREIAEAQLALARRTGDREIELLGYECLIGAHLISGDMADADRAIESYERTASLLRQPISLFMASQLRASQLLNRGCYEAAEEHMRASLELGRGTVPFAEVLFGGLVYWSLFQRGELIDFAQSESFFRSLPERFTGVESLLTAALALNFVTQGEPGLAREQLEALAGSGFRDLARDEGWLLTLAICSDVVSHLDDRRHAEQLFALLEPYRELFVTHDLLRAVAGSVASVLGDLATTLGRYDEALRWFAVALRREETAGLRQAVLSTRAGQARALLGRAGPGDRERAGALVGEIDAGIRELGIRRGSRHEQLRQRLGEMTKVL